MAVLAINFILLLWHQLRFSDTLHECTSPGTRRPLEAADSFTSLDSHKVSTEYYTSYSVVNVFLFCVSWMFILL